MKALLVDDETVALQALKKRVDWVKYGFTEVLLARDAAEAKDLLAGNAVALAMCDIEMPGESGLELVEYIRQHYPQTECIMETCHADFDYLRKSIQCRVFEYVLKPIDFEELDGILSRFAKEHDEQRNLEAINRVIERTGREKPREEEFPGDRLEIVKQYIREHLQEKIYVEDLARLVHINEQYFMRLFKRATGQTVTEYITGQKILLAGNLLKNTDRSINFIADCIGCENYSYFTKLFKKYTGLTPREYRNQFKSAK